MAGHQVGADGWQSGEQEVHVEFYLAALPEDVCLGRERGRGRGGRLFLEFQVFLNSSHTKLLGHLSLGDTCKSHK